MLLRYFMFFVAQNEFLALSFFVILIMIYLFNSLIQSAIFECYRVIQLSGDFTSESQEMKNKFHGILKEASSKMKSLFKK